MLGKTESKIVQQTFIRSCKSTTAIGLIVAGLMICPAMLIGQQNDLTPIVVTDGLNNPTGVAVQPETGIVFIAESGAQRIVKIVDEKPVPVVVGFDKDAYGKGPIYDIGPLGLMFLDKNTLVVTGGGQSDGEDSVFCFRLSDDAKTPIDASVSAEDGNDALLGSVSLKGNDERVGEGNFFGVCKGAKGLYVTGKGDAKKGWVSRVTFDDEKRLTGFARLIATTEATNLPTPRAITFSPLGHVTVGQMGSVRDKQDSLLTFYSEEGVLKDQFPTGLYDITGLAYGPEHGRLFATDFSWAKADRGGLFKIVATKNKAGCKSVLMCKLERPSALAFAAKGGDLYVTLAGNPNKKKPDGKLIKFIEVDIDPTK